MSEPLSHLLARERVSQVLQDEAGSPHLLLFTGDPDKRIETGDVAVIAQQLLDEVPALRLGVVAREAEASLRARWGVKTVPSLVSTVTGHVLPRVAAWQDYRTMAAEAVKGDER